jgi:hypothetical protein
MKIMKRSYLIAAVISLIGGAAAHAQTASLPEEGVPYRLVCEHAGVAYDVSYDTKTATCVLQIADAHSDSNPYESFIFSKSEAAGFYNLYNLGTKSYMQIGTSFNTLHDSSGEKWWQTTCFTLPARPLGDATYWLNRTAEWGIKTLKDSLLIFNLNLNSSHPTAPTTFLGCGYAAGCGVLANQNSVKAYRFHCVPATKLVPTAAGARNAAIKQYNLTIDTAAITIPVDHDTDISNFDPQLYGTPDCVVSPAGAQDFSKGAVDYTFTGTGGTKHYAVSVEADGNPILSGFYADPEVMYSHKTGLLYVYPTSDGYSSWSGYTFDVFSTTDMVHYTNEGTILNVKKGGDVAWASGSGWAPCIEE